MLLARHVLCWGGTRYPYWYGSPAAPQATKCSNSNRNYLASMIVKGDAKDPDYYNMYMYHQVYLYII